MITVKTTPPAYSSAHNANYFVVSSDNVAQANFKYVFDVYVNSVLVTRVKVFPEPEYGYGVFNASKVIQSYLKNNYFKGAKGVVQGVTTEGSFKVSYQVKFGEEYGTPVTTYTNLVTGDPVAAYNYYNELLPMGTQTNIAGFADKLLSNRPTMEKVSLTDYSYIYYFNPAAAEQTITVKTYDLYNALLTTQTTTSSADLIQIGYGPANINYQWAGTIDEAVFYYTVEVGSEKLTLTMDGCSKFQSFQLVFLNKLGGFDTVPMRFKSSRSTQLERKAFGKSSMRLNADGTISSFESGTTDVLIGSEQTYAVGQKNFFKLTTDNLNEHEWQWLHELAGSPLVYLQLSERNTKSTEGRKTEVTEGSISDGVTGALTDEAGSDLLAEDGTVFLSEGSGTPMASPVTTRVSPSSLSIDVTHFPVKLKMDNYEFKKWHQGITSLEVEAEILQNYNSQFS